MNRTTALAALADPTRRRIYERVVRRPRSVGELARALPISQPAVSHVESLWQDVLLAFAAYAEAEAAREDAGKSGGRLRT